MFSPISRRELLSAGALALPLGGLVTPSRLAAEDQTGDSAALGDLFEIMAWLGRTNAPRLSFLDGAFKDLETWKRAARPVYAQRLAYDPTPLPLAAEVVSREERDDLLVEKVRIKATPAYDIPACVLVPKKHMGPLPGIAVLHCHGGQYLYGHEKMVASAADPAPLVEYRAKLYGRAYADVLARRGNVVIAIDAFYFGERRLKAEELEAAQGPAETGDIFKRLRTVERGTTEWMSTVNSLCHHYEAIVAKSLLAAGATWPGLLAWDDRRSIDYLGSRPEVDAQRIGCLGLSLGGIRAAQLAGLDPRIKATCVTAWMTEFGPMLRNHLRSHTWMAYTPGLYPSLDLPDVAALTAPGALLVQQCRRDHLFPMAGMQGAIDKLASIYRKAGLTERFRGTFYDEPHSFLPQAQEEAFAWLERWL
jgi:dienelactone hydrolase